MERIQLTKKIEIECKDGSVYEVSPGPQGLAFRAVEVPLVPRSTGSGRPPRPSTMRLRERLEADARAGRIGPGPEYIEWLRAVDNGLSRALAANTVYRERRAVIKAYPDAKVVESRAGPAAGDGKPGRKPSKATVMLRQRLAKDAKAGKVRPAKEYVAWLVRRANTSAQKARPIVYRERRQYVGTPS